MRRKKKHHGGHENSERWLLTYADMITLLVAFFIMLYAMSVMSKEKFEQLALSVRSGFDGNTKMQAVSLSPGTGIAMSNALISPDHIAKPEFHIHGVKSNDGGPSDTKAREAREQESMDEVKRLIETEAKQHGIVSMLQVSENERGLVIRILTDNLLFAKGDGHLQPHSEWILDGIASAINRVPNSIAVEGHTDDLPIHTAQYPSNWELSTSRATNVLRYLLEHGHVRANRVCAAGYADTRPLVANDNEADRSRNRRVDIVIFRSSEPPVDDGSVPDTGSGSGSGSGDAAPSGRKNR